MMKDMTKDKKCELMNQLDRIFSEPGKKTAECPVCGGTIRFNVTGNSYEYKCDTKNCIHATVRGL